MRLLNRRRSEDREPAAEEIAAAEEDADDEPDVLTILQPRTRPQFPVALGAPRGIVERLDYEQRLNSYLVNIDSVYLGDAWRETPKRRRWLIRNYERFLRMLSAEDEVDPWRTYNEYIASGAKALPISSEERLEKAEIAVHAHLAKMGATFTPKPRIIEADFKPAEVFKRYAEVKAKLAAARSAPSPEVEDGGE